MPGIETQRNGDGKLAQIAGQEGTATDRPLRFGKEVLTEAPVVKPRVLLDSRHTPRVAGLLDEELREQSGRLDVLGREDRVEVLDLL